MNPSAWKQRIYFALVALLATFISVYLGLYQLKIIPTVWEPFFGNGTKNVLDSDLSHQFTLWIGFPDALLGTIFYFLDVILALLGSDQRYKERPWLVILFGISVIPVGIAGIILVALQAFVIGSWCFLCLVSAALSLLLIVMAWPEVMAGLRTIQERRNNTL